MRQKQIEIIKYKYKHDVSALLIKENMNISEISEAIHRCTGRSIEILCMFYKNKANSFSMD